MQSNLKRGHGAFFSFGETLRYVNSGKRKLIPSESQRLPASWWFSFLPVSIGLAGIVVAATIGSHKLKPGPPNGSGTPWSGFLANVCVAIGGVALIITLVGFGLLWRKFAELVGRTGTSFIWWVPFPFALWTYVGFVTEVIGFPSANGVNRVDAVVAIAISLVGFEMCEAFVWQAIGESHLRKKSLKQSQQSAND